MKNVVENLMLSVCQLKISGEEMELLKEKQNQMNICNHCYQEIKGVYYTYSGYIYCLNCFNILMQEEYNKRLNTLPPKYHNIIDKYDAESKAKLLKNKSLYIWGETGSGKSVLAVMILKLHWKENKSAKFVHYPEFIFELTHAEHAQDMIPKIDEISYCKNLVILDDFGAERLTDAVRQISYLIIERRESHYLQTIITSNFSLSEIDKLIDRRISSRIAGMCQIIEMKGDKRIKQKEGI